MICKFSLSDSMADSVPLLPQGPHRATHMYLPSSGAGKASLGQLRTQFRKIRQARADQVNMMTTKDTSTS